jgi:hypothetical protein
VKNLPIGFGSRPSSVFQRLRYPVDYPKNFSEEISDFTKHGKDDLRPSVFHRLGPIPRNPRQLRQSTDPIRHADRVACAHRRSRYLNSKSERDLGGVSILNEDHLKAKNIVHDARSSRFNGHMIPGRVQRNFSGSCYNCLGWGHSCATCSSPIRCKSCFNYGHKSRNCFARCRKKSYRLKLPAFTVLSSASVGKSPSGAEQAGNKSASLGDHVSPLSSSPTLSPATVSTPLP